MSETLLGNFFFRHIAEDHKREAQKEYPDREIEVREINRPYGKRYYVILSGEKNGQTAG